MISRAAWNCAIKSGPPPLEIDPELSAARNSILTGTALYKQYRTGLGQPNITDMNVTRLIEIGLKYRF